MLNMRWFRGVGLVSRPRREVRRRALRVIEHLEARMLMAGNVLMRQYDHSLTGSTSAETVLNTTNVQATTFGKLANYPTDGYVYTQPLYVQNVNVPGGGRQERALRGDRAR